MPDRIASRGATALLVLTIAVMAPGPGLHGQQQEPVQVAVTAVPNPVPAGDSCTGIWAEARDRANQRLDALATGLRLNSQAYEYTAPSAPELYWQGGNPASGTLCVRPDAGMVRTMVTATIRGTAYNGATIVTFAPRTSVPAQVATVPAPAASSPGGPAPGQPYVPPTVVVAPPQTGAPPASGQPIPIAADQAQVYTASASSPAPPSSGPAPAPPQLTAASAPPPNAAAVALVQPEKKKGGGFFGKIGKHLKEKAGEVANQTTENLASSANQVVDATAQTGSNLVSGAAAQATNVAQTKVSGIGTSLVPSALRVGASSDNLSLAVASGNAELRTIRFVGDPPYMLNPDGLQLARRLAEILKTTPGAFEIQIHVDPLPSPATPGESQKLSESRAGSVKNELVRNGVDAFRLCALGYGTSEPKLEVPPEGGAASSARVVIRKMEQKTALSPTADPCLNR